ICLALSRCVFVFCFFFQAEDGIRDFHVTGIQTCALPIFLLGGGGVPGGDIHDATARRWTACGLRPCRDPLGWPIGGARSVLLSEIGRASCRERVSMWAVCGGLIAKHDRHTETLVVGWCSV